MTPVTPQRAPRSALHSHHHSVSQSHFRSPISPASPYTPLSLRSFASSNPSPSPLTTPASAKNYTYDNNRHSYASPLVAKTSSVSPADKSLADITKNWRSRAQENGIKVSSVGSDQMSFDDHDDHSFSEANDSRFATDDEVLLPAPFLSTRRRRAFSQSLPPSQAASSPVTRRMQPSSPLVSRTLHAERLIAATPPRNLARELKLKGCMTDPPQRRRQAFGVMPQNIPNMTDPNISLNLFDIDENDYEYDYDEQEYEDSLDHHQLNRSPLLALHSPQQSHIPNHNYGPYPFLRSGSSSPPLLPSFGQPTFSDIFNSGSGYMMSSSDMDSVDQHFNYHPQELPLHQQFQIPASSPLNLAPIDHMPRTTSSTPVPQTLPSTCSVCSRANSARLAILSPCQHPLCPSCLTSALNIVGEKDMECAVCKQDVVDFKLVTLLPDGMKEQPPRPPGLPDLGQRQDSHDADNKSFFEESMFSPTARGPPGLDSAFKGFNLSDASIRVSTPPPANHATSGRTSSEYIVLRIDNVPWDITPPSIGAWLQQPIERAHVLLDRKGKTMSHAFVEVLDEKIAGSILRGEVANSTSRRGDMASSASNRGRGAVLGRGRRARGVTITRSSQEELMTALFPSWCGRFDGARPSLAGLNNDHVITALESGLMTESEVAALLYLIRSPDAHFLKVPCLPFHSLISIITKFPADMDSRVFWTGGLRDTLYDVTYAAIQVLSARMADEVNKTSDADAETPYANDLFKELVVAGSSCEAFTPQQTAQLAKFMHIDADNDSASGSAYNSDADAENEADDESADQWTTPSSTTVGSASPSESRVHSEVTSVEEPGAGTTHIGDLAREFGVQTELIQALVDRLTAAGLR